MQNTTWRKDHMCSPSLANKSMPCALRNVVAVRHMAFLPTGLVVPSVPSDSDETLCGPISLNDFDFFVGQLPNRKAAVGLPY